ncbi:hypothetical protein P3T73_12610 [Kiritimatiellota bacterium B12222]|nr:hypothetical protein P3T73_12610 [Kiritimatiellota bacterium B12222]
MKLSRQLFILGLFIIAPPAILRSDVIFTEDFSSSTLEHESNGYLGGWFSDLVDFDQWLSGDYGEITTSETLKIFNEAPNTTRSAAIVLSPDAFETAGVGTYTLSYDIVNYAGSVGDYASVNVWSGSGYGPPGETGNALIINTLSSTVPTAGSAISTELTSNTHTTTGTGFSMNFNWDGVSAIVLNLGGYNVNYPHLSVEYDNIQIFGGNVPVIPEMSSLWLMILSFSGIMGVTVFKRHRKAC